MVNVQNRSVTREAKLRELTPEQIESRTAEFVISTEAADTYGTVFKLDGWDMQRYLQNPIVMYGHKTHSDNPDMLIGTSEVRVQDGKLIGKVKFEEEDVNPTAERIWKKVKAGTLRMASIGANILEYRWGDQTKGEDASLLYFTRQELLEWSIVPVGSNPDALLRERQTIEELRTISANQLEVNDPLHVDAEDRTIKLSVREAQLSINKNS